MIATNIFLAQRRNIKNTLLKRLLTNISHNMQPLYLRILCGCFLLSPGLLQANVIYVNQAAAGASNGTSWTDGFTSLSTALLAAKSGDEIWIKKGVHKPVTKVDFDLSGGNDEREATFQVPSGVALYGGFSGVEVNRDERNIDLYLTILSGDIDNNDLNLDANNIAENAGHIVGNNVYHIIYTVNVIADTRVDGVVITGGKAVIAGIKTNPNLDGGGWYNKLIRPGFASSPTIVNTRFQGNYADSEGGAIYNTNALKGGSVLSLIENCKFISNKSGGAGGAIVLGSFSSGDYNVTVQGCDFISNEALLNGGAMYLYGDHAKIDSCKFLNNKVTVISMDGLSFAGAGGAVQMVGSNAVFDRSIFKGNSATGVPTGPYESGGGGAVHIGINEQQSTNLGKSEPAFTGCGFYDNYSGGNTSSWGGAVVHVCDAGQLSPKYINCVFSGNHAQNDGGAMANYTRVLATVEGYTPTFNLAITNCTFVKNHAGKKGGGIYTEGYIWKTKQVMNWRIENSITWDNSAGTSAPEIFNNGNNVVANSLIKGSGGSGDGWKIAVGTDGGNNIDVSPGFVNINDQDGADNLPATADDGLKLKAYSAAVNKGNNAAMGLQGINVDFVSAARVKGGKVDMGAYEYQRFTGPGTITSSSINKETVSSAKSEKQDFSIFPMPAHTQFTIMNQQLNSGIYIMKIFNSAGRLERQERIMINNGNTTIPVKGLVPGTYILQLISAPGIAISKKIVIE